MRLHRHRRVRQRHGQGAGRDRRDKLANIRLHHGDASELLDWLPARIARAHRPALSRSVAEAAALEASLHPGREPQAAGAHPAGRGGEFRFATDIPIMRPGRWRACCVRRISSGPPKAPTIGACPGRIFPAHATKRRPSARAARRPISSFAKMREAVTPALITRASTFLPQRETWTASGSWPRRNLPKFYSRCPGGPARSAPRAGRSLRSAGRNSRSAASSVCG